MPNNETLKNRFMERHAKVLAAVQLIKASIDMIKTIKDESAKTKVIKNFLPTLSQYDVDAGDLEQVKQILNEFTTGKMSQNEALAYLNYLYDTTDCKAFSMMQIHDIFGCYF